MRSGNETKLIHERQTNMVKVIRWNNGTRTELDVEPTPFGSERAREIWLTRKGPDITANMTDGEHAYVNSQVRESDYNWASAFFRILNMTAAQETIVNYMKGQNDPSKPPSASTLRCFVGMVQTGEATIDDFRAVGGEPLADAVAKGLAQYE